ncbi:AAA family ATPase [Bradyrhizobium sp. dw_411]|uniref:AAA family ATPase n=1 Tax=Bradyrhizobium sp. dw_411 TaxID=2720082 RepID=UPI001BD0E984
MEKNTPESGNLAGAGIYWRVQPWIHDNPVGFFFREVQGKPLRHIVHEKLTADSWSLDLLGEFKKVLYASESWEGERKSLILRHDTDLISLVELVDGWAEIFTAGNDAEAVERTSASVVKQIDSGEETAVVPITFWATDPDKRPVPYMRKLEAPRWADLSSNYDANVAEGMGQLFALKSCPKERLILWHGQPGTGKTYALRALLREWQSWCDAAFITDAERFVGGAPTYLFQVARFGGGRVAAQANKRSKLIILEDAGELMTTEARATTGQGFSRLLNLTDGLMGQGLDVIVLITTNEPLSAMHPAVLRPGRCLSEMEFGPLSVEAANRWLRANGSGVTVAKPTSLAQLYAVVGGGKGTDRGVPDATAT